MFLWTATTRGLFRPEISFWALMGWRGHESRFMRLAKSITAPAAVLQVTGSLLEIPTTGTLGLLVLGMLLAAGAVWRLRI